MFKKIIQINLAFLFIANLSFSEIVEKVLINGNKRLSNESIVVFGNIELNKDYNSKDLNNILKNLYESDFFKEVSINIENKTLLINVVENPIIQEIKVNGIKQKKLKELLLSKMILKNRKSYIEEIFSQDVNFVKNILKQSGYYFSKVKTSFIENKDQNSVILTYDIDLGSKAKIGKIIFLGDKKIKDRKLSNVITTEEAKFWKFISNRTNLDNQRINLDTRLLTSYYKNKGYFNVKVENSFVEFTDDNSFNLIFNINAGDKYAFNKLTLDMPVDYEKKYFKSIEKLLKELENETYSLNKIEKIIKEIDKIALSKQYEFINASMSEEISGKNKIDISISLEETEKYYVEKINIFGNQYTQEDVIRNSFIVDEGDPYNELLFNKSINTIKSKNIFGEVETTIREGSDKNLKVIDISVTEKPTGEISLGAGVGTSGGQIGGGIKENNFLGKGISLDTNLTFSENTVKGSFIYAKPNFNYSDNTLFTSVSSTSKDNLTDSGYKSSNTGISVATQFEQYENFYFKPEIAFEYESLETSSSATSNLKKQEGTYSDLYFNYNLDYDLRNQRYQPTSGYRSIFYQELPVVSNSYEITNLYDYTKYMELPSEMVVKLNLFGKAVNTLNNKDVRISKRLSMSSRKLRGFEKGKIGPVDKNDYIGGNYMYGFGASSSLPQILPSLENADFSIFFDAGNVYGVDYDTTIDDSNKLRSSVGISLDLLTPIGPLNFSLAQPISKMSTDKTETFRFNLGTTF